MRRFPRRLARSVRHVPATFALVLLAALASAGLPASAWAQAADPGAAYPPTPGMDRVAASESRFDLHATSLVKNVPWRNVGPTVMSGRIVDVEASPSDPLTFYAAYATGGLWRTTDGGITFEPMFEDEHVGFLGDIAVDWGRTGRIWVGTGEVNSSRSSYAGTGVYVSDDGGKSWRHRGLAGTQHIGKIDLDPSSPDVALVASLGPLYSAGGERGIFKTRDAGQTWTNVLPLGGNTGAVDIARDPSNPNRVYASVWERTRRAWDFSEGGEGSKIYVSSDGGDTWAPLGGTGFPSGATVGRIGLATSAADPAVLYAVVDNQAARPEEPARAGAPARETLTRERLRTMPRDEFLRLAPALVEAYLETNGFPASYTAQSVLAQVRSGQLQPVALVEYLEDANANLFNRPVVGAELYRSSDRGATWTKTHAGFIDGLYYSYGYYFGTLAVSPLDARKVYLLGVPIIRSDDGGATWTNIGGANVHADHHDLYVSGTRPGHLINGNDGGINVSYNDGETWFKANTPSVGQFYTVQVDDATPYRVYGGLQDNGVWVGPSTYTPSSGWNDSGRYPYRRINGGDGMQVQVDPRDNETVYSGSQFGFYQRYDPETERAETVRPQHVLGERPPRYNWQTPILLSRHNADILYMGADRLYRSFNQGRTFEPISPDLTLGGRPGDVPYGTLTSIDESPLRFGLLYAGTDDGLLHVSRDGGFTWTRITDGLPPNLWVSRVAASRHAEGRVYASLNGYRFDHMDAYVYRSDDYGATWTRIGANLPAEPVNVVVEDPKNANHVYVGTDGGAYASLDGGATFMGMGRGLPSVPVHDLKIQARERDLVAGTHGRSIWIADIGLIGAIDSAMMARRLYVYPVQRTTRSGDWGRRGAIFEETEAPLVSIGIWASVTGPATITVRDSSGAVVRRMEKPLDRGLNFVPYDLTTDSTGLARGVEARYPASDDGRRYLTVGKYRVVVEAGGSTSEAVLEVASVPPRRRRTPGGP